MQQDQDFYEHLGKLPNGKQRQSAYSKYKNADRNYCFELNGALRAGHSIDNYLDKIEQINAIIRARNKAPLELYRLTSNHEFTPGVESLLGLPFRYPPFLSTTRDINVLRNFLPSSGIPTLLKIKCPIGTPVALMEANSGLVNEAEVLLQSGTQYRINDTSEIKTKRTINEYIGGTGQQKHSIMFSLEIEVISPAPSIDSVPDSHFIDLDIS